MFLILCKDIEECQIFARLSILNIQKQEICASHSPM